MATNAQQLPFNRTAGGNLPKEELEGAMSMTRIGLFFIAALAIGIIIVAVMNIKMGAKNTTGGDTEAAEEGSDDQNDKKSSNYPNLYRDYIVLSLSSLTVLVAAASIFMSFPKKA